MVLFVAWSFEGSDHGLHTAYPLWVSEGAFFGGRPADRYYNVIEALWQKSEMLLEGAGAWVGRQDAK